MTALAEELEKLAQYCDITTSVPESQTGAVAYAFMVQILKVLHSKEPSPFLRSVLHLYKAHLYTSQDTALSTATLLELRNLHAEAKVALFAAPYGGKNNRTFHLLWLATKPRPLELLSIARIMDLEYGKNTSLETYVQALATLQLSPCVTIEL